MKLKRVRKVLTAVLVTTMVLSSSLMVSAVSDNDSSAGDSGNDSSSSSSEPQEEYIPPTYEETMSQTANAPVSVAGTEVRTSVSGVYAALGVSGTAVTTPLDEIRTSLGLVEGQNPVIIIYDLDTQKSVHAAACIDAAAEAMDAEVVTNLYIDLGAKQDGEWVTLSDGSAALVTGLPKGTDTSKKFSVLCVQRGGVVTVLEDQDSNPDTVTFSVQAGLGAYAIVAE